MACHAAKADFFRHGLLVTLRSLRVSNPDLPVVIAHDGLSAEQERHLDGCRLWRIATTPSHAERRLDLTAAAFFKLHVGELDGFDKVLCLDADTVVVDSLDPLFSSNHMVSARRERFCLAHDFADLGRITTQEGLHDSSPFMNSGVVLIDHRQWTTNRCDALAREIFTTYGSAMFKNGDQGILNILAARTGGFHDVGLRFNSCRWPDMMNARWHRLTRNSNGRLQPRYFRWLGRFRGSGWIPPFGLTGDATIVHWNGLEKPWRVKKSAPKRLALECYLQFTSACS